MSILYENILYLEYKIRIILAVKKYFFEKCEFSCRQEQQVSSMLIFQLKILIDRGSTTNYGPEGI